MSRSRLSQSFILVIVAILWLFGVGHGLMRHIANTPHSRAADEILYIEPGAAVGQVAMEAARLGLVRAPWHFKLITRWKGLERSLYAGEYELPAGASLGEFLAQVALQNTFKRRIVVPEGASVAEITNLLQSGFGVDLRGYVPPEEGTVLPETYFYERGDTAVAIVERMQQAFNIVFEEMWAARAPDLPYQSKKDAIILASIVEKETAVANERSLVAAVFTNRLRKGMRLQSDPTVVYGITGGLPLGRPITVGDLRSDTPYNSYRRSGLPPTAIANPGREAIMAALNPAASSFLYFVADGSGGHAFATTLEEHNRNVARWRQIEKAKR